MTLLISTAVEREKVTHIKDLSRVGPEFVLPEIRRELQLVALEENADQSRIGNPPSRVVIDKTKVIELSEHEVRQLQYNRGRYLAFRPDVVNRRISFYYTSNEVVKEAVLYAWEALQTLTRKLKGQAWGSMYLWCSEPGRGGKKFEDVGGALRWLDGAEHPLTNVRILGPLTEYRRFVIYSPAGTTKQKLKTTRLRDAYSDRKRTAAMHRYKFLRPTNLREKKGVVKRSRGKGAIATSWSANARQKKYRGQPRAILAKAIGELVVTRVKRQFRDIWVGYRFTKSREALKLYNSPNWRPSGENIYIPEIYIGRRSTQRAGGRRGGAG